MSKKILVIVCVTVTAFVIGYYIFYSLFRPYTTATNWSKITEQVPIKDLFEGEKVQLFNETIPLVFKNAQTGDIISLTGSYYRGNKGPTVAYINQENVGEIEGSGILSPSFSPDNKYFAFRETADYSTTFDSFNIYVMDLINKKILFIVPPQETKDFTAEKSHIGYEVFPFIESYSWEEKDNIQIIFFFVGVDGYYSKTYRISPKEIWNYNLADKKYTMVKTIAE